MTSSKNEVDFPSDPEIIEEYLWVINKINKERERTPNGESISFPVTSRTLLAAGVPLPAQETSILRKLEQNRIIRITKKELECDSLDDIYNMNTFVRAITIPNLKNFEDYKAKLNQIKEQKNEFSEKDILQDNKDINGNSQPCIRYKSLELIAKEIGEMDTGTNLIDFLINCGVKKELIEQTTKWKMVYIILISLSSSNAKDDYITLCNILEGACHPLSHDGNETTAIWYEKRFNKLLKYDHFEIIDGIIWRGLPDMITGEYEDWMDKNGNIFEASGYSIFPNDICRIFVYWSAIIDITKFYLSNKTAVDNNLNLLYWELIDNLEQVINNNGCGELKTEYKKPFQTIIGCELIAKQHGETEEDIMSKLYCFLGKISDVYMPWKEGLEKVKTEKDIFDKIDLYLRECNANIIKSKSIQEVDQNTNIETSRQIKEPLHIIVDKIQENVGVKGFEEKVVLQKPKNKRIQLRNFPADLKWEEITMKFLNGDEVIITARKKVFQIDYNALGFQNEKNKRPNEQWKFLQRLAQRNGELSWRNNKNLPLKDINSAKKQKQLLAETLKAYFQIEEDPFNDYWKEKSYKLKIILIPEQQPSSNEDGELNTSFDEQIIDKYGSYKNKTDME